MLDSYTVVKQIGMVIALSKLGQVVDEYYSRTTHR